MGLTWVCWWLEACWSCIRVPCPSEISGISPVYYDIVFWVIYDMLFKNCRFPWISHVHIGNYTHFNLHVCSSYPWFLVGYIYISLVHLQPLSNQQKSTQFLLVKLCSTVQYIFLCCSKPFLKSGKMRETSPAEAAEPAVRSLVMRPLTKKRERSRDPAFSRCVVRCVVRLWLTSRFVWSYQQLISL